MNFIFSSGFPPPPFFFNKYKKKGPVGLRFCFGAEKISGFINVSTETFYQDKEDAYGLDFNTSIKIIKRIGDDGIVSSFCTSNEPFYFSVQLPEGNYTVHITTGDPVGISDTTVKAETRSLMLYKIETQNGEIVKHEFTVNIRNPQIPKYSSMVRLLGLELRKLHWDDKLTLEFSGEKPCVHKIEVFETDNAITVFLAGNSTLADQDNEPYATWGQMMPVFFEKDVAIANLAKDGSSLADFISEKRFLKILSCIEPGDFFLIEFGHIDKKDKTENALARFVDNLRYLIDETRAFGGTPVLVTPSNRRIFSGNSIVNSLGDYPEAIRSLSLEKDVPLIDLHKITKIFFEALGPEKSLLATINCPAYTWPGQTEEIKDNTHFNGYGAFEIAKFMVEEIRNKLPGLAIYIKKSIGRFDPESPAAIELYNIPLSPFMPQLKNYFFRQ